MQQHGAIARHAWYGDNCERWVSYWRLVSKSLHLVVVFGNRLIGVEVPRACARDLQKHIQ